MIYLHTVNCINHLFAHSLDDFKYFSLAQIILFDINNLFSDSLNGLQFII